MEDKLSEVKQRTNKLGQGAVRARVRKMTRGALRNKKMGHRAKGGSLQLRESRTGKGSQVRKLRSKATGARGQSTKTVSKKAWERIRECNKGVRRTRKVEEYMTHFVS